MNNEIKFTKHFSNFGKDILTLFQYTLQEQRIRHKFIRPFAPSHNGKAEHSPQKDNERFYASYTFYFLEYFSTLLQRYHCRDSNQFPLHPFGWKSSQTILREFMQYGVTYV